MSKFFFPFLRAVPDIAASSELNIQLRNTLWILRKSCNHPYLIEYPLTEGGQFKVDEQLINTSGKLMLLDKMLQALKKNGHKVGVNSNTAHFLFYHSIIETLFRLH